ncbi:DUF1508 domain-containing protein [Hellea sp.]|nr:DUF1508 domain-containing protein [Hellea sp.]
MADPMDYIDDVKRYDAGADVSQTPTVDERHLESKYEKFMLGKNDKWEFYRDKIGEYRWRRKSTGLIVGASCQGYKQESDCEANAERHGMLGNPNAIGENDNWEIYTDAENKYRWRRKAENGKIVGASAESYASEADCRSNANRNGM